MAKHSTATNSIRVPAWYKYLKAITTTSPASYALKEEFSISNPESLIKPTFTIPDVSAASAPTWITAWDGSQNSVNFGRVLHTRNDHSANVAHWILSIDDFSSTTLTPRSASMTLGIFPECHLDNSFIKHRKRHKQ